MSPVRDLPTGGMRFPGPVFPVEGFRLSPSVVITLYYIAFNISIGKGNNIAFDILSILYIAFNRQTCYNIAIMGGVAGISGPPTGRSLTMAVTKAQQKAVSKYMKENYDVYQIRMPKGKKDTIKAHAEARGESVNAFINRAIDEAMEREAER